jgi:NTP pyrophosphatase (non-canonical NTP hydrolase)
MNVNQYEQLAMKTEASQSTILARFTQMTYEEKIILVELMNGIHGLTDEVGEINSALKKHFEYGQPLDRNNLKEEVGDCLWRLSQICKSLDITLEECMAANIEKLQKGRYKDGYSDEAAKEENRDREEESKLVEQIGIPLPKIHQEFTLTKKDLEDIRIQNGNGFGEPPEDESEEQPDLYVLHPDNVKMFHKGVDVGVKLAEEVADLMDGQERKEALRMIEARKGDIFNDPIQAR